MMRRSPVIPPLGALCGRSKRRFSIFFSVRPSDSAVPRLMTSARSMGALIAHTRSFVTSSSLGSLEGEEIHTESIDVLGKYDALWLRDSCKCEMCVDPSSKQKRFQTPDIPLDIEYSIEEVDSNGAVKLKWSSDISGFGSNHTSTFSKEDLEMLVKGPINLSDTRASEMILWNKTTISGSVKFLNFSDYMSDDSVLYEALQQLHIYGLVFLKGVTASETAVEDIGGRIGTLKDTFYGRTWDVKSVPKAKNVAYTNDFLGLHMDLLYMDNPPSVQLLHCIKNSCEGGLSMFSDSFHAASAIQNHNPKLFRFLASQRIVFEYDNDGKLYRQRRPMFKIKPSTSGDPSLVNVNWSPPFQGPFENRPPLGFRTLVKGMKAFSNIVESPKNMFEYRLGEGDCVLFANRRVLHARTAFDISSGERWLKGAYLDRDVVRSRHSVLMRKFGQGIGSAPAGRIYRSILKKE